MNNPLRIFDLKDEAPTPKTEHLLENIENSPLVQKINNSNFDFNKIAVSKTTILIMAYYYYIHFDAFDKVTTYQKVEVFHKCVKKEHRSVSVSELDWLEFAKIPVVVFFKNERVKTQRRLHIQTAQNILMNSKSTTIDIKRAQAMLRIYKDFIDEQETSDKNLGLIVSHVFLTEVQEHIQREIRSKKTK